MTPEERVLAVRGMGFTEREASFLVAVMLHAGVFLRRQYCASAGIPRGRAAHAFLERLTCLGYASHYRAAHRGAFIYHVHGKRLYRAIGEPDNRHRRPVTLARAIERLMLLDAVLDTPGTRWLATEREKVDYFVKDRLVPPDLLPRLAFGRQSGQGLRYFPDKLPIGVVEDGATPVFLYGVTRERPLEFRAFLHRHAELLRALRTWEIRLLVTPEQEAVLPAFEWAAQEELAEPLAPETATDLRWYFEQRQVIDGGGVPADPGRFEALRRSFAAQRHRVLYRAWQADGTAPVYATTSPVLRAAMDARDGRVTRHVLRHPYLHLTPLVGTA
ncbi:MAG: hypothetical protein KJ066_00045 [Acidobacteria bacterium]|nr:hypothetical protein [Acidobacteriota bacterium]